MSAWRCLQHSQGCSHLRGEGQTLAAPPATPTRGRRRRHLSFAYPGAMDRVVKVRSFRGQQQPATINGFGLQRNSRETHQVEKKTPHHGPAPQGINGQGLWETAAAPGTSSGSCTQANSALPVWGTRCSMAACGITYSVGKQNRDEDSGGRKTPATNT